MAFYVGQEVECIDADESMSRLTKGAKYTIARSGLIIDVPGVWIVGVAHPIRDIGWFASRFRPIIKRSTSISIFTAMLGPKQKETIDG